MLSIGQTYNPTDLDRTLTFNLNSVTMLPNYYPSDPTIGAFESEEALPRDWDYIGPGLGER